MSPIFSCHVFSRYKYKASNTCEYTRDLDNSLLSSYGKRRTNNEQRTYSFIQLIFNGQMNIKNSTKVFLFFPFHLNTVTKYRWKRNNSFVFLLQCVELISTATNCYDFEVLNKKILGCHSPFKAPKAHDALKRKMYNYINTEMYKLIPPKRRSIFHHILYLKC